MKYYSYTGTLSEISGDRAEPIVLDDVLDDKKAPIMLYCYNEGLHKYLCDRGNTDAEERYINQFFIFNSCLELYAIVIPSGTFTPAKVIAVKSPSGIWSDEIVIFGGEELIDVADPEPMSKDESQAWNDFMYEHKIFPTR